MLDGVHTWDMSDSDESTNELMAVIASTVEDIGRDGFAVCKECDLKVYGDSLDEILQMMGEHGESEHGL